MLFSSFLTASVLSAPALAAPSVAETPSKTLKKRATAICGQWDTVATGTYTLYQDLWGESAASSGSQCSTYNSLLGNTISWSTNWTYTGSNIVADVSYDMFTSSSATGSNEYEIMIWLAALGGAGPISSTGTPVSTPTINGVSWKLYSGPNGATTVYSFVAASEVTSFSGDIKLFLTYLAANEGYSTSQRIDDDLNIQTDLDGHNCWHDFRKGWHKYESHYDDHKQSGFNHRGFIVWPMWWDWLDWPNNLRERDLHV
ncbi:Xyloglucanendohydrolase A [Hyphodiscus hymeniophilus]|uniref:Xyloglucanendohydrolase A n=1 Tax=Hyphodiscus hymeniophilus TaxID=353542 RepID=A0A9P7AXJ1_9HELO|nr:Xyloglucanendohydrolase A [Hyphodiscus hymeniophilus]